jgi:hypothetical protein
MTENTNMNTNVHAMRTRSKREEIHDYHKSTHYYPYIVLGLLPLYTLFGIAFYFLVANIGYNSIPAVLYLGVGAAMYGAIMKTLIYQ